MATAGYSGTPLAKKLGITAESRVVSIGAPKEYRDWLAPIPAGVVFGRAVNADTRLVHLFTTERAVLERELTRLRDLIASDAMVWISWPKKAARVLTDITEDVIREVALPMGYVDVKVCAVSEVWSGLKLVIRKSLR